MRRPAGIHRTGPRPILALLVLCAFALAPVEYRGGAAHAHAHSPFQLWYDVADGALDHHGHGNDAGAAATAPSGPAGTTRATEAPPDTPRLSASLSAERAPLIVAFGVASAVLVVGSIRFRPVWQAPSAWPSRPFRPEPPPPRPLAASA